MSELELIKKIESYLFHQMNEKDRLSFESEIENNSYINAKVKEHSEFLKAIKNYGETKSLKANLELLHEELFPAQQNITVQSPPSWMVVWNKYKRNLAVAASVAILTTLVTLYSTGQFQTQNQIPTYNALKRDMESIKRSQNALIRDINSKGANKEVAPSQFGGTGFALSSDGYLVTNYHVVEGADSVYVQSNKGDSYKVNTIYIDPSYDIAILQIADSQFTSFSSIPYTFKKSLSDLGEDVYTIGYPRDEIVLGKGYLSAQTGFGGDSIQYQVSLPVNPGNSGGPLLDSKGNIIGVISGKQTQVDGAAFAIKSDYLLKTIENIPQDSLKSRIVLNKKNLLAGTSKVQQIKKIQDYIFMVKVYNH